MAATTTHRASEPDAKPAAHKASNPGAKAAATTRSAAGAGATTRMPSPQVAAAIIDGAQRTPRVHAQGSNRPQPSPPSAKAPMPPPAVPRMTKAMPVALSVVPKPPAAAASTTLVATRSATAGIAAGAAAAAAAATATARPPPAAKTAMPVVSAKGAPAIAPHAEASTATPAGAPGAEAPTAAPTAASAPVASSEAASPAAASPEAATPRTAEGSAAAAQGAATDKPKAAGGDKGKAPAQGDGAEPEGEAVAGAAGPAVKLHMPEPPTTNSPKATARIHGVQARAGGRAAAHGSLPAGADQTAGARDAVTEPSAEALAKAQQALIAQVNAAPSPEIVQLCERIKEVIKNKRPPDEDALMQAKPEGEAMAAGNQLNETVEGESKKVAANYGAMNQPASGEAKPGADLPPQPAVAATPGVNAKAAVPDAVPASQVSLDQDAAENKKKAQDAGMDTPAAQLVQTGPVAEARNAQGELEQAAKEDPAKVLAAQKEVLGKAEGDMAALQAQALAALTASRTGTEKSNTSRQTSMVGSEEQQRTKAALDAKKTFDDAKTQVDALLKPLASNAMAEWEAAKDVLATQFKADLAPVQKRVDERHSGASGFVVGLWDAVTGLPGWAEEGYARAETRFGDGVIAKLTSISTQVNAVIATCDLIIKTARERIAQIFSGLPDSLKAWAEGERAKFDGQLDRLHDEVIAARDNFNKDLVERSSAAVDEVRAEIAELRKKAGGLIGRIVNAINRFIDDPVKFIIEGLLEILGIPPAAFWAVVAKIKKVVKDIAADPLGFANNLMKGLAEGFGMFFDHFGTHLIKGFLGWLLGGLKDVQIPKDVSVKSIVTFFLQLMGITWPNIRKILVKKVGAKNVALVEKVYSLVSLLIEKGPEGIYEMIKEKLDPQSIVDQVVDMAVDFMVTAIAKQVAARIIMLFNPAGAIAQALEAIYRVLKWIFQNAARIFTLVETVVNGITDILAGNTSGFAAAVDKALGMLIAPVIGFIADYMSLGDLPSIVADKVKSMREWILGMIESALTWIIEKGKALLAAVGIGGKDKDKKKSRPDDEAVGEEKGFDARGESHRLWISVKGHHAEVMVASNTQTLESYLNDVEAEAGSDAVAGPRIKSAKAILGRLGPDANRLALLLAQRASAPEQEVATATAEDAKVAEGQETVKSEEDQLVDDLRIIFEVLNPIQQVIGLKIDDLEKAPFGYQFTTVVELRELQRAGGFGASDHKRFPPVHVNLEGLIELGKGPSRYDQKLILEFRKAVDTAKERLEYDEAPTFDGSPESLISRLEAATGNRAVGNRKQMERFIDIVAKGEVVIGAEVDIGARRSVDHTLMSSASGDAFGIAVEYKHWTGTLSQHRRKKLFTRLRDQLGTQLVMISRGKKFAEFRIEWPEFYNLDRLSQANFMLVFREVEGMGRELNIRVVVFSKEA